MIKDLKDEYSTAFCLTLILFLGIPHGAVDHKIHQTTTKQSNISSYLVSYLFISLGYTIWWILDPAKALFIFFILSSYHFGQELLEDAKLSNINPVISLLWGSLILIAPIFFNPLEIDSFVNIITGYSLKGINQLQAFSVVIIIYLMALIHLIYAYLKKYLETTKLIQLLSFVVINTFLHLNLSFISAFTIYFVCYHSLNAFKHQYNWLSLNKRDYSLKKFIIDLTGFSLLSILGIIVLFIIFKPSNQASLITLFFILISIVTLPHAITLDQFYKVRKSKINRFNSSNLDSTEYVH
ncbi:MAG: Brp/Blh family beta-carotene 15,15'-dioxygenase [Bacteroidota bacterium]